MEPLLILAACRSLTISSSCDSLQPDAVPASDSGHNSDVDAQAAGDGIAESGNSIWTSRSRPEQVQDV